MTYFFETYGCQMNVSESNGLERILILRGWKKAVKPSNADLIIINTCSVRITAEERVFGRLGFYSGLKKKTELKILVMGCMAERLKAELTKKFPFVDFVVGISDRNKLESIFTSLENSKNYVALTTLKNDKTQILPQSSNEKYLFTKNSYREGDFQSFVPIMNGCNNFCSYCIVPYVRGREVSRDAEKILAEIQELCKKNVQEITLLGQNVNSYSGIFEGGKIDFPDLLELICQICEKNDSIKWIRFVSSHPKDMSEKLMDVIAREKRICKGIHLPVQNGSNRILKAMNRKYTVEHYLKLVEMLRQKIPVIAITTDILVGFPGETEEDLEATLDLMRKVEFDSAFMYHYNPREGTKAFDLKNRIPKKIKIERLQRVINLQQKITKKKMTEKIGAETTVLVESRSRNTANELFGHTEAGEMVVLKNASEKKIGQCVKVMLEYVKGRTFIGNLIEK